MSYNLRWREYIISNPEHELEITPLDGEISIAVFRLGGKVRRTLAFHVVFERKLGSVEQRVGGAPFFFLLIRA